MESPHAHAGEVIKLNRTNRAVDLTLFVACYNEEENIVVTLDELTAALKQVTCTWEILIIDDASRDRSVELIRSYQDSHPTLPIYLTVNATNRGLGHNYEAAARTGMGTYYRLICGDNSEPTDTFVKVFGLVGQADIIIPYHGEVPGKSLFRRKLSRTYTALVNLISGYHLHYYNGLAVHLRENVIRCQTRSGGFGFQADILTKLLDEGASYLEVAVRAQERTKGQSKVLTIKNIFSVANTLLTLIRRRIRRLWFSAAKPGDRFASPDRAGPVRTNMFRQIDWRVKTNLRRGKVMGIFESVWDTPGFFLGARLNPVELQTLRDLVHQQWIRRLAAINEDIADDGNRLGMEQYHLMQHRVDHHSIWPKQSRLLPVDCLPRLKSMEFYQRIVAEFKNVMLLDNEQIWRLVRPDEENDVGPIHADGWFWDYGNGGYGESPEGFDRFKIWIPLFTEPGRNGLCVVPDSHRHEWKHHQETRHGIAKPVLDERVEDLDIQLLPLNAGEMVMFHDRLLHGGVVNRGSKCRVSFEMTVFVDEQFATLAHPGVSTRRRLSA